MTKQCYTTKPDGYVEAWAAEKSNPRDKGFAKPFIPRVGMVGSSAPSNVGGPQPDHLNPKPWAGLNANW